LCQPLSSLSAIDVQLRSYLSVMVGILLEAL
jgi:hypothetical protein